MASGQQREYELGHETPGRLLTRYSVPAITGMMANGLYNMVDTLFVGRGVGTAALAGLGVCVPVQIFVMAVALTLGVGSASIVSRSLGRGDRERARRSSGAALMAGAILSLLMTALGLASLAPLLRFCGAAGDSFGHAYEYLAVVLLGNFFLCFAVIANQLVRAEGSAKVSMIAMLIGAGMNIVLDPIFIFWLGMGVRGAALATVLAQMCAFVYLLTYLLGPHSLLRIRRGGMGIDVRLLREVLAIGSSSFVRLSGGTLLTILTYRSIQHYGGTDVHRAVFGLFMRLQRVMFMPLIGTIHGLRPIVGFNYGARNPGRVLRALQVAAVRLTMIASCEFLLLQLLPATLLSVFLSRRDPNAAAVLAQGPRIIRTIVLFMPLMGVQIVGGGFFQAIGKGVPALVLSLGRQMLFFVPLVFICPRFFGLGGIWCAFPASDVLSATLSVAWLSGEVLRLGRVTARQLAD